MGPASPPNDQTGDERRPWLQPVCPCCSGTLFPARGFFQCARCNFRLCEGCEGPENPLDADG
jgi:hypothetical protein